jgi:hypothetical protein
MVVKSQSVEGKHSWSPGGHACAFVVISADSEGSSMLADMHPCDDATESVLCVVCHVCLVVWL